MVIRILIVDDDPFVRTGLKAILGSADGLEVVAEAHDGVEAIEKVHLHHPDVVFMDLQMPRMNGNEATRAIRSLPNPPAIVVLTSLNVDDTCLQALEAGACSFVIKAAPNEDLIRAARTALTDEPFYSPAAAKTMRAALPGGPDAASEQQFGLLTAREREIAAHLREGYSNRQIASALHLSEGTVKSHINQMLTRLDLANRTQLAVLADRAMR